jgi:3-deoxy-7-phosphoheptulonate synthase
MSKAAIACGANGLMIEVHDRPEEALSDGAQALDPLDFANLVKSCRQVFKAALK